jgi:hypothetical protein
MTFSTYFVEAMTSVYVRNAYSLKFRTFCILLLCSSAIEASCRSAAAAAAKKETSAAVSAAAACAFAAANCSYEFSTSGVSSIMCASIEPFTGEKDRK